jgi:hypothetical protein
MRRALLAVIAGGTLLAGAACDGGAKTTAAPEPALSTAPAHSLPPLPDYTANTNLVCGRLNTIYQGELRAFGAAMGTMITYKEAKQAPDAEKAEDTAVAKLKAVAVKIRKDTGAAQDPEFKAAGVISAMKVETSVKDRKYFAKVKTLKDLNATIEGQFAQWLTPVSGYCRTQ